jgi:hypothetical protein
MKHLEMHRILTRSCINLYVLQFRFINQTKIAIIEYFYGIVAMNHERENYFRYLKSLTVIWHELFFSAENYRPVSRKLLEHIMKHLEMHRILTSLNHGSRSGYSCETQLLVTLHDFMDCKSMLPSVIALGSYNRPEHSS